MPHTAVLGSKVYGPALMAFGAALLVRVWLLWWYPPIYGGDTVLYLRNSRHILLGHQLPLLHVLIFLSYRITAEPIVFRCVMALIGALAGTGFYLAAASVCGGTAALCAALFFASNPFLNEISIVPFAEIIMLGTLCWAAYFYSRNRLAAASIALGLACLTRYEAWIACPILMLDYILRARDDNWRFAKAIALFGWTPAVWVAAHAGISEPGTFVMEMPTSMLRLFRWVYVGWIAVKRTPEPVILLGLIGAIEVWKRQLFRKREAKLLFCFAALFLVSVLFSAHGTARTLGGETERFVSSREATLPIAGLLLLAGLGVEAVFEMRRARFLSIGAVALGIVAGLFESARFIASETSQPAVQLSYQLARFMDSHAGRNQRALVIAREFSAEELDPYLTKARQTGGESGYEIARQRLRNADLSPFDFQRTAVQSRIADDRLVPKGDIGKADWVAVWSDAAWQPFRGKDRGKDRKDRGKDIDGLKPATVLSSGPLYVTVYRKAEPLQR